MTAPPSVLQVVILRDGLLVGTEVFVPGSFTVGSSPQAEVKLDDPLVDPLHAVLYFQNGRSAIQDNSSRGGVYVNGHKVRACEVRSQDEIIVGPFVLKTRVVAKEAAVPRPAPSPEVAALLGAPAPAASAPRPPSPPAVPAAGAGSSGPTLPGVRAAQAGPVGGAGTVLSARRAAAMAAAPHLREVEPVPLEQDAPTEHVIVPGAVLEESTVTSPHLMDYGHQETVPGLHFAAAAAVTDPGTRTGPAPLPPPRAQPPAPAARPAAARPARALSAPKLQAVDLKAKQRLYFELYWGELRRDARSFGETKKNLPIQAGPSDTAALPLWGFSLPEDRFPIAQAALNGSYRVFVPPGAVVEKQGTGADAFYPVSPRELEAEGGRRFLTLSSGMAARFSEGEMSLVAYVAAQPPRLVGNLLKDLPWLAISLFVVLAAGFLGFILFGPKPREVPDFKAHSLPPVAVKLMMPEPKKKEAAQKKLAELKAAAKKKAPDAKPKKVAQKPAPRQPAKPPPPESKALKALAKLSAAGPASRDVLAAVDKLGSGPGSKKSKNDFRVSGLVGKAPIANAGLGSFGLGGGGKGGQATKGLEMLNGRGGGGVGALGAKGFGKGGAVGGVVSKASSRRVSAQGNIDRDAVAKVINSHMQEIRGCYERALLKDPSLAGKAVLQWTISTSGTVVSAKTKSSSLRSADVEGCILRAIKSWRFPKARGGAVIISYPFVFNAVGY